MFDEMSGLLTVGDRVPVSESRRLKHPVPERFYIFVSIAVEGATVTVFQPRTSEVRKEILRPRIAVINDNDLLDLAVVRFSVGAVIP